MLKMVSVLIALVVVYFGLVLLLYFKQKDFIFYPTKLNQNYHFSQFKNAEELYFTATDSASIHALHFKTKMPKGIVLYFHGNAGALDKWGFEASEFTSRGYDVVMPDYRTYGKSSGKLSERNLNDDALMIYQKIAENTSPTDIVLYGRSLGSGIATELATKVDAKLLILETPYTSIGDVAKRGFFFLPLSYLLKFHFSNDQKINKLKCPVHLIHGTEDELIPYSHSLKLAEIYGDSSILTTIEGGSHNNLVAFETFQNALDELLR
jgi:pimeloyl-ACP methyl ester carboxylesterase